MTQLHDDPAPSALPRPLWVLRFATALHKLRPHLATAEVMTIANEEFAHERDRQPERWAEICAERSGAVLRTDTKQR